ncbi:MAG: prephenate dehydrogenase [Bacteroidia bacterium]|nr:prephenate dehydrogenase [Bacteroidia bacterium]
MIVSIIGLGLIGGSLALDLRSNGFASRLIGVDLKREHQEQAMELGLVDEIMEWEEACKVADILILTVPVSAILKQLPKALDLVREDALVMDMGSTKSEIKQSISGHPKRKRAVLAHPMAGTEYSGPKAAIHNLFHRKVAIICDPTESDKDALELAERLLKSLFMRIIYMDAREHDVHAAYVSHVSHISSFVLALTVLEKEKSEANIFNMASGGFASTVRLAKSSPKMWRDVYEQNADNLIDVLEIYIKKMQAFKGLIESGEFDKTAELMQEANEIGRILKETPHLMKYS